jgi:hypothetical protein
MRLIADLSFFCLVSEIAGRFASMFSFDQADLRKLLTVRQRKAGFHIHFLERSLE